MKKLLVLIMALALVAGMGVSALAQTPDAEDSTSFYLQVISPNIRWSEGFSLGDTGGPYPLQTLQDPLIAFTTENFELANWQDFLSQVEVQSTTTYRFDIYLRHVSYSQWLAAGVVMNTNQAHIGAPGYFATAWDIMATDRYGDDLPWVAQSWTWTFKAEGQSNTWPENDQDDNSVNNAVFHDVTARLVGTDVDGETQGTAGMRRFEEFPAGVYHVFAGARVYQDLD